MLTSWQANGAGGFTAAYWSRRTWKMQLQRFSINEIAHRVDAKVIPALEMIVLLLNYHLRLVWDAQALQKWLGICKNNLQHPFPPDVSLKSGCLVHLS